MLKKEAELFIDNNELANLEENKTNRFPWDHILSV